MRASRRERGRVDAATAEWRSIANQPDVLYLICSWPEKKGRWTEEEFYASGESDWADFLHHWRHYEPDVGGACLEIGCGLGRVTRSLRTHFDRVVALDVSPDLLARARAAVGGDVEFLQGAGSEVPLPDNDVDAAFSVHVFQHLEHWSMVTGYLEEVRRVLRPGGTLMLHIGVESVRPGPVHRLRQELRLRRSRRALRRGQEPWAFRMNLVRMEDVFTALGALGFVDLELRVFPVRLNGFHHSFFFARKPTG